MNPLLPANVNPLPIALPAMLGPVPSPWASNPSYTTHNVPQVNMPNSALMSTAQMNADMNAARLHAAGNAFMNAARVSAMNAAELTAVRLMQSKRARPTDMDEMVLHMGDTNTGVLPKKRRVSRADARDTDIDGPSDDLPVSQTRVEQKMVGCCVCVCVCVCVCLRVPMRTDG